MSVIEWLGAYFIESQFCEKAVPFFERATVIQSVTHIIQLSLLSSVGCNGVEILWLLKTLKTILFARY